MVSLVERETLNPDTPPPKNKEVLEQKHLYFLNLRNRIR